MRVRSNLLLLRAYPYPPPPESCLACSAYEVVADRLHDLGERILFELYLAGDKPSDTYGEISRLRRFDEIVAAKLKASSRPHATQLLYVWSSLAIVMATRHSQCSLLATRSTRRGMSAMRLPTMAAQGLWICVR